VGEDTLRLVQRKWTVLRGLGLERWSWIAGIVAAVAAVLPLVFSTPAPPTPIDGATFAAAIIKASEEHGAERERLRTESDAQKRKIADLERLAEDLKKQAADRTGPPGLAEVMTRVEKGGDPAELERLLTGFADRRATEGRTAALEAAKAYRQAATLAQWRDTKSAGTLIVRATEATPDDASLWIERGRIEFQSGDLAAAQSSARRARSAAEAAGDKRTVSVARIDLGDALTAAGEREAALTEYRAALDLAKALAATDPGNAEWKRDLSVSHNRIGDALTAKGEREAALIDYRAALDLAKALAATDPGNAEWKRDLSVSHNEIGDALTAKGEREAALIEYRAALDIAEALAATDPGNAQWKRDLVVSYYRLASLSEPGEAAGWYGRALTIALEMSVAGTLAPVDAWIPEDLRRRIAEAKAEDD